MTVQSSLVQSEVRPLKRSRALGTPARRQIGEAFATSKPDPESEPDPARLPFAPNLEEDVERCGELGPEHSYAAGADENEAETLPNQAQG
ncbi:MAG: hypothetical protein WA985_12240 [Erythrobacter sp.]